MGTQRNTGWPRPDRGQQPRGMGRLRLAIATSMALAVNGSGCGPAAPAAVVPQGPTPVATAPTSTDALLSASTSVLDSPRWPVRLPLPDLAGWRESTARSSFLVLEHPASSSSLVVRVWREAEIVTREDCERRARSLRQLPVADAPGAVERERIDVPPGFDTLVEAGASPGAPGGRIAGYLLAFGGWAHQCFAYAYTTSVAGPGASQLVAARLALMRDDSLGRLAVRSDTERPPRPLPPDPQTIR
jgi:hypothetical protein